MNGLVLIAEGDPFDLRLLQELCEEAGFDVVTAGDGETALNVVARQRPALIVLDGSLRTDDGAGVLEVLVSDPALRTIPVLLTTGPDEDDVRRRGLELGAADFVSRPYRVWEVEHRISALLRLSAAERALARASDQLSATDDGLDPITHTGGGAQLRMSLEYETSRALRYEHPLTCVVLRVANMSAIVSASGSDAGLGVLVQLAANLRRAIRAIDHLFRVDDDEFVILLPQTGRTDAEVVLDRLRAEAQAGGLTGTAIEPAPVLELGVSSLRGRAEIASGEALVQAARAALAPLA